MTTTPTNTITCSCCGSEKDSLLFRKNKKQCRSCEIEKNKLYAIKNKDSLYSYYKRYRDATKEQRAEKYHTHPKTLARKEAAKKAAEEKQRKHEELPEQKSALAGESTKKTCCDSCGKNIESYIFARNRHYCNDCIAARRLEYYKNYRNKNKEKIQNYSRKGKSKTRARKQALGRLCRCCGIIKPIAVFGPGIKFCKPCRVARKNELCHKNREKRKLIYIQRRESILARRKKYRAENKHKFYPLYKKQNILNREYRRKYFHTRMKTDPLFRLSVNIRSLIYHSLKKRGYTKKSKTFALVGLSCDELRTHLETTWLKNYGSTYKGEAVHIDHIIPCVSAKTEEELLKLQHWTNLQYLTPCDNLVKSANVPGVTRCG